MEYSEMANTQNTPAGGGLVDEDFIPVLTPKNLRVDRLPARRIALGQLDDQKPSLVLLPDGQLLLTIGTPDEPGETTAGGSKTTAVRVAKSKSLLSANRYFVSIGTIFFIRSLIF